MVEVTIVGCGNLGSALVRGLARTEEHRVTGYDVDPAALAAVEPDCHRTTTDLADATGGADVVFLAVKPDTVEIALAELALSPAQTLVTVAAGVSKAFVEARTDATVVRIMPNLAAETGDMAAAVTWDEPDDDVAAILETLGEYVEIDEEDMDLATALNGSGPAFVFYLIQAMQRAAIDEGLPPAAAKTLAAQTFKGAAETVKRSPEDIDALIDAVCSPGGTTIEGMEILWDSDVDETVGEALVAAAERSRELAEDVEHE